MALHKKLLALCGFLAGGLTTFTAAFDVDDLDAAILQDILESYTEHVPSTCTGDAASSTSFTYDFPGTNPDSEWYPSFVNFEQDLFLAEMTHTDDNNNTWIIRIGQGGNIYSHFCPDLHGESMPPQAHVDAPWIDEVFQSVSVNNDLNKREGMCNDDICPAYYIHGAGTYQQDAPDTNVPFYSPSLAKHCDKNTCTFAAWGQQAHVATIFTSPVITLNRYTNCGDGVIEHTEMVHNFAPIGSNSTITDQSYFNVPWTGVRSSALPFALKPKANGELSYTNPDTVDYCPLCRWGDGHDDPGGPQGRCDRADLQDLGGYTTFVGNGLYVNREDQKPYLWCRKPGADCFTDVAGCMAEPDECYNADNSPKAGYTPVVLEVPANSNPDCQDRANNPFPNGWEIRCKMHSSGFGFTSPSLTAVAASDSCAPWTEAKMGFYRPDTNEGFEATFIRHWSYSAGDNWLYLRVDAPNYIEAKNMVHSVFDNSNSDVPLSIRFQVTPPANVVPDGYNPAALPSVTFVAGYGVSVVAGYGVSGGNGRFFRRRMGSSARDYTVYTINYYGGQVDLEAGYSLSKRAYVFAGPLGSVKATADSLKSNVVYDVIEDTRYNSRVINIYKSGTSFDVVAASSAQGTSTTCTSPSATLECSGYSAPTQGYSPFFYVTCGSSSYLGPDPYFFTPGNDESFIFPGMSNDNNKKIRAYLCDGQDASVRPTWKLIGFFDSVCALGSGVTYDDDICVRQGPSSQPSLEPSLVPTPVPENYLVSEKQYVWCRKPGVCDSGNWRTCMATPGECYTEDQTGPPQTGYTPIKFIVPANSNPQCSDRGRFGNEQELMCKLRTTGYGQTRANLRAPAGSIMGFYREDNDEGFEVSFVRHWSWRHHDQWVYIRMVSPNFQAARNAVNSAMNNVGNAEALPIRFEVRTLFE